MSLFVIPIWLTVNPPKGKAGLVTETGKVFVIPHGPHTSQSGMATELGSAPRIGLKPAGWVGGKQLRVISWTMVITGRSTPEGSAHDAIDPTTSCERLLADLQAIAESGERISIRNYGASVVGWFRCSSMTVNERRRVPDTNEISVAEVDLEFTEATEARTYVGPVSGGALIVAKQAVHPGAQASFMPGSSVGDAVNAGAAAASTGVVGGALGIFNARNIGLGIQPGFGSRSTFYSTVPGLGIQPGFGQTNLQRVIGAFGGPDLDGPRTYVVQAGDTWQSIAYAAYGNGALWRRLADANGWTKAGSPPVGATITLPA